MRELRPIAECAALERSPLARSVAANHNTRFTSRISPFLGYRPVRLVHHQGARPVVIRDDLEVTETGAQFLELGARLARPSVHLLAIGQLVDEFIRTGKPQLRSQPERPAHGRFARCPGEAPRIRRACGDLILADDVASRTVPANPALVDPPPP